MMRVLVNKNVLMVSLAMVLYYAIMELYYLHFIGLNYFRLGFYMDINTGKYIETKFIFLLILVASIFISRVSEFSYSILVLFLIFFLVPALITYSFANQPPGPLYSIVALLFSIGIFSSQRIKIPPIQNQFFSSGVLMLFLLAALIPFVYIFGADFSLNTFLLNDISKSRDYYDENSSTLINYLYNWLVKAVVPLLLIYFLIHRQYRFALICIVALLYLYIISGNKLVYITSFVMLFFFFVGKGYLSKIKYFSLALLLALLVLPLVDHYVLHNHSLKGIFVMRMLFLPAQLNHFYFDFFNGQPLYFAESSFFKLFVSYPYDKPVGFVIAETYFKTSDMNANNGIISDGFMNLGYIGIALNILIVSGIFLFFNSISPDSRYLGIFFVIIFMLLSVPMLSIFITSGLWIILLMGLTLMRSKRSVGQLDHG